MLSLRSTAHATGLTVLTAFAFGCDDGETVTFREKKCDEICARYEMCNDETDVTDCESDCSAESFRSDTFFDVKAQCVTDLSCNRLDERDESVALNDCISDDLREKKLGDDALDICMGLSNKLVDCPVDVNTSEVREDCERIAITLSEEYLDGSGDCSRLTCSELSACLSDLADTYDTDVKIYSGPSTK